jgi:hypothetical protein
MQKEIPTSVLRLLKHQWKPGDSDSSFDSVFNDAQDKKRRKRPSYYHIRQGRKIENEFDVFTYEEACQLVREGSFGPLAVLRDENVTINEHAQHAMADFCSEVYSAWAKYKHRISEVETVGVYPKQA